jgi:hypothetical protein
LAQQKIKGIVCLEKKIDYGFYRAAAKNIKLLKPRKKMILILSLANLNT